jgi:hypothetical protein
MGLVAGLSESAKHPVEPVARLCAWRGSINDHVSGVRLDSSANRCPLISIACVKPPWVEQDLVGGTHRIGVNAVARKMA